MPPKAAFHMGPDKDSAPKIAFISLPISLNMCFGCSKEQSHREGSFEYPQHMFWLSNKKKVWRPDYIWVITVCQSTYLLVFRMENVNLIQYL